MEYLILLGGVGLVPLIWATQCEEHTLELVRDHSVDYSFDVSLVEDNHFGREIGDKKDYSKSVEIYLLFMLILTALLIGF